MSLSVSPSPIGGIPPDAKLQASGRADVMAAGSVAQPALAIPHDCAPETLPEDSGADTSNARMTGIDFARALALIGVIAVGVLAQADAAGRMSPAFVLAWGKAAPLLAVIAGIGIAFTTGRTHRPKGRRWLGAMARVAVRGLLIASVGLAIGIVVPVDTAAIILPYFGLLFLLAIPFLRLPPVALAACALVIAIGVPILSHDLRADLPAAVIGNPTFATLLDAPLATMQKLLLTGLYPALPWLAYICAGLAVGRLTLVGRGVMLRLAAVGVGLATLAAIGNSVLMKQMGGSAALAHVATPMMSRDDYTHMLVWGANGTLPTNSPWWLAVLAPHTTTPFDILFTMGIALAVIGASLTFALVAPGLLGPVAQLGRMPLTMYAAHLLLLRVPVLPATGVVAFVIHLVVLGSLVLVWGHFFKRGPLEQVVWWVSDHVDRLVGGPLEQKHVPAHSAGPTT